MKTFLNSRSFLTAFTAVLLLLLPSCDKDKEDDVIIWDILPVSADIHIKDAAGNNLLNPSVAGNIFGKRIVAEYDGKEYELDWESADKTRAIMSYFSGLTLDYGYTTNGDAFQPDPDKAFLSFGQFEGEKSQDISLTLHIEGYTDTWNIDVVHRIKWDEKKPEISNSAFLNGTEVSYFGITIIL